MTRRLDCVVVGQGIAGTTLAWQLRRRGRSVIVIDRESEHTSSRVAAGLITPVTGKRLARSWRWDELFPAAVAFYRSLEAELGGSFLRQRPAIRLFADEAERDEFRKRERGILAGLVSEADFRSEWFNAPFGAFEMPLAARLDVPRYLDVSREHFRRHDAYHAADLDLAHDVELTADGVRLPRLNIEAKQLVLCRGFTPETDPWFGGIRFKAAKGEILTLRIPALSEDRVVHRGVWLAPLGGELFRCGATYTWEPLDCETTTDGREVIETRLRGFLRLPFDVIEHHAGVRPVIDAGYPVLGTHPERPQLAYFNGLGSKGSLLAPFFAEHLAAVLAGEREPDRDVDVRRY